MINDYYLNFLDYSTKEFVYCDPLSYKCIFASDDNSVPDNLEPIPYKAVVTCSNPLEQGMAFLWYNKNNIHVVAIMEDSDVRTKAVGKNDKTWLKGDLMEFLFMPPNKINYFEVHLAPNLATLELALPSVTGWRSIKRENLFFDSGLKVKTGMFTNQSGKRGWWGHMNIPLSNLSVNDKQLDGARFSVCRYNYNSIWEKQPELSSTSAFKEVNFHQPDLWHIITT